MQTALTSGCWGVQASFRSTPPHPEEGWTHSHTHTVTHTDTDTDTQTHRHTHTHTHTVTLSSPEARGLGRG